MTYYDSSHGRFSHWTQSWQVGVIVFLVVSLLSVSCSPPPEEARTEVDYPQPRYPGIWSTRIWTNF